MMKNQIFLGLIMQNKKNAIHISSFDFDGCLLPDNLELTVQATLLAALKAQNEGFKVNIGMIGSNRQDKNIDIVNQRGRDIIASAFHTLPKVYEKSGIEFDPVLLADVYAMQAQGSAYKYAINGQLDPSTFHTQYIFDEYKCSLLYFQIHQAAMNARACDFIVIEHDTELKNLSLRSNAAYVYCKNPRKLCYINKMQDILEEIAIPEKINQFIELYESVDIQQKRNCFERNNTFGFQLNDEDLESFNHAQLDYPIYFDFYDDRQEILDFVKELFEKNPALLPSNAVLRLHRYNVTDHYSREWLLDMNTQSIQGNGFINPNPAHTLNQFARKVHRISTEEISFDSLGIEVLSRAMSDSKNQSEILKAHCVKVSQTEQDEQFGLIQYYSTQKNIAALIDYQRKLSSNFQTQWAFFDANKQYSDSEQRAAISELIECLKGTNEAFLSAHLIPVLKRGPLGQLIQDLQIDLAEQPVRDVYQTSLHQALNAYKVQRQERCILNYFNPIFSGYAKYDKFAAVDAILIATHVIEENGTCHIDLSDKFKEVLTQGQLAKTLNENKVQLSFVNDREQALACLSYSFIDTVPRVKKIEKIRELIKNQGLSDEARAAGLVVAFALSTKSWFSNGKDFGDTTSMHRFCLALLKPNTFSRGIRQAVLKLAGLEQQLEKLATTPLEFTDCLWDSRERCEASELLRTKLLTNMGDIIEKAKPVLGIQKELAKDHGLWNQELGQELSFR